MGTGDRNILLLLFVLALGVLAGGRSEEADRGAEIPAGGMAKGGGERGTLLPVSADDGKGNDGGGGGDDAVLFKGSAMTRRGGAAALSYMACSGTRYARSSPSRAASFACLRGRPRRRRVDCSRFRVRCFVRRVRGI